jgi:4-amino-4-deoxy-L-arabinose transferase-like glycosyltransferase
MKSIWKKIIIVATLLVAAAVRLYDLGNYPALNADEAAIGYNAYSLLETGKDEHGNPWPIHFQSFNDYKPGLYFYLVMPFVRFMGLNEWSVRLPNALLGIATVYLIYALTKIVLSKSSEKVNPEKVALLAAFMLAISPWHIHFSRGGWEVNTATFLITLGILLFYQSLRESRYLIISVLSFAAAMYTYHAARAVLPLVGLGLGIIFWKKLLKNFKTVIVSGIFGLLVLTPLIINLTQGEISSRAAGVGLFADAGPLARINEQRGEHSDFRGLFPIIMHNKLINYGLSFMENMGEHFHGDFLFLSGDVIERNKVPEMGQMYIIDFLFVLSGLVFIFYRWGKDNTSDRHILGILVWLALAPFAASLTFQSPHALRAQNMVVPIIMVSAFGLYGVSIWLKNKISSKGPLYLTYGLISFSMLLCFVRYQHMYWTHMSKQYPYSSQYGVKELVNYVENVNADYENVVVTTTYDQPYILFLFYLKYPPGEFQKSHKLSERDNYGFSTVEKFDKFVFKPIKWDTDKLDYSRSLIVGTDDDIPTEANVIENIYGSNGHKYFEVVAN